MDLSKLPPGLNMSPVGSHGSGRLDATDDCPECIRKRMQRRQILALTPTEWELEKLKRQLLAACSDISALADTLAQTAVAMDVVYLHTVDNNHRHMQESLDTVGQLLAALREDFSRFEEEVERGRKPVVVAKTARAPDPPSAPPNDSLR